MYTVKLIIGQTRLFEKDLEATCKHPVGRGIDVKKYELLTSFGSITGQVKLEWAEWIMTFAVFISDNFVIDVWSLYAPTETSLDCDLTAFVFI